MSKKLEQFIKDNRDEFDKFEPGPVVWHNIQQQLNKPPQKKGILISMKVLRWSAAAVVMVVIGLGAYYFTQIKKPESVAQISGKNNSTTPLALQKDTPKEISENKDVIETPEEKIARANASDDKDVYNEELYHYARLVEIKQNEIRKIKKDEPLLYQKFAGDINKLDSTFHTLKKELPVNPNHEQILEAMIQNLQLQEALLNQQLSIIKKINHTKTSEYEKAYKSI